LEKVTGRQQQQQAADCLGSMQWSAARRVVGVMRGDTHCDRHGVGVAVAVVLAVGGSSLLPRQEIETMAANP